MRCYIPFQGGTKFTETRFEPAYGSTIGVIFIRLDNNNGPMSVVNEIGYMEVGVMASCVEYQNEQYSCAPFGVYRYINLAEHINWFDRTQNLLRLP